MRYVQLFFFLIFLAQAILIPSNDVSNPTEIITQGRGANVLSDATVNTPLPIPEQLSTVMDITIQAGAQYCNIIDTQPELLRLNSYSIETKSRQVKTNWNVEIISSVYDSFGQVMYILIDNGTLVATSFVTDGSSQPGITRSYSYMQIGAVQTWLIGRYELIFAFGRLYILMKNEVLRFVILHDEGYWKISDNLASTSVIFASYRNNYLYILTNKELFRLNKEGTLEEIGVKGQKFIDVHINGDDYFLLDEKVGLVMGQLSNPASMKIFKIERVELSKKVKAYKNVLFIIYQFQKRNFLGEYFLSNNQITLNRYYHNYYSIKQIHLTDDYAIIDAYNEFILLRHSINRRSFSSLSPAEYLFKSIGVKVVKIDLLGHSNNFTFIATFKEKVEHLSFSKTTLTREQQEINVINTMYVACQSNEPRNFITSITYKGLCSSPYKSAQSFYCTAKITDSVSVEYSHVKKLEEHKTNRFIFIIAFVCLLLFSCLLLLAGKKRISKLYKQLKMKEETMRNQKEQHSMNMEKTFNADIEKKT